MTQTNWTLYRIADYPGNLWRDWQTLVEENHANNPMLDECFVRLLVDNFGQADRLHVLVGFVARRVIALAIVQPVGVGRWRTFRPSQAQIALLVTRGDAVIAWQTLVEAFPWLCWRIDLFALDPIEHQPFLNQDGAFEDHTASHDIVIELCESFNSYWENRPRKLKSNIRRYLRRLDELESNIEMRVASTPDEIEAATDRYGILESRGWKGEMGTALHPGNSQGAFYRRFMGAMSSVSRALAFELFCGERLVASRLCVMGDDRLVMLKTTYDEDFRRFAIGRVHLYFVLKHIFQNELVSTIDFYTNASEDQISWSTATRFMIHRTVFRSHFAQRLFDLAKWMKSAMNGV